MLLFLVTLAACEVDDGGFGNAGTVPSGGSTGGTTTQPSCPDANGGPSAPCLLDLVATYDEIDNYGPVLDVAVAYTDPEDDLVGGQLEIQVTGGSLDGASVTVSIDEATDSGREAWVEDGSLRFVASVDSLDESYEVRVQAWDAAGNASNELAVNVSP